VNRKKYSETMSNARVVEIAKISTG
jgi:hypothetical protein